MKLYESKYSFISSSFNHFLLKPDNEEKIRIKESLAIASSHANKGHKYILSLNKCNYR